MKKLFVCLFMLTLFAVYGGKMPVEQFFRTAQDAAKQNGSTYGVLEGTASHVRREKGRKIVEEYPCFMAVIITPGKSITQIILNNDEGYFVGRVAAESTSVRSIGKKSSVMQRIGVSPRDLSMSFLDGKLIKELPSETLRMVKCRVLLLKCSKPDEWCRIYVAEDYFFVLKAEFFTSEPTETSKPVRTLEVDSFAQKNKLYYTQSLVISGPGWRTDIAFDKADMNIYDPSQGTSIFRSLK